MKISTRKHEAWIIGDPHLGRTFNGIKLHRKGEREAAQLQQFKDELATPDVSMVVMIGDLFDKPFVPLPAIEAAARAVFEAALARPNVQFVMMAGNHDKSRQLGVRGAWEVFSMAVSWMPNVLVVDTPQQIDDIAFFPWEWAVPAADQVPFIVEAHTAIGHWDLQSFGGDDSHIAPTIMLAAKGVEQMFSGHYHVAGDYDVEGHTVVCTGSMQPYTFAEDPEGDLYVTLTVEEALARDDLHDKCVRLILQPGEDEPDLDCLMQTKQRADAELIEVEVSTGNFNVRGTIEAEFAENQVPAPVVTYIEERLGGFA